MNDIILLKQGEIVLKGLNKRDFEQRLIKNVKYRLGKIAEFNVYALQSTVYAEPMSDCDMAAALDAAKKVFGANTVTKAAACEKDKDAIIETASKYLATELKTAKTFKVESKRADKRFPMSSIELSQYVGGTLHDLFPHLKPDMNNPELTVHVEIRDHAAYIHGPALQGGGGLPTGTGGRMVTLLSGGIDSPAASYLMAKRGVELIPVHFYSHPYTSVAAKEKVIKLTEILTEYCGWLKPVLISFTKIQEQIRENCPENLLTVLMRRFMMRIAERIAKDNGCTAIITGDNLGQVASQTAEALAVTEQCIDIPVFRPLIAMDKKEIVDVARKIGTYETSILPYEDCCTVFTPRRPKTKPKLDEVLEAETLLDVEGLIEEALKGIL